MVLRDRWGNANPLDKALIVMVMLACIALLGVSLRAPHSGSSPSKVAREPVLAASEIQSVPEDVPVSSRGRTVLIIINMESPESIHIGTYYAKKRHVPKSNIVQLHTSLDEEVNQATFDKEIRDPTIAALKASKNPVDYMLFTSGVPIRVLENGYSIDSELATTEIKDTMISHKTTTGEIWFIDNPYFNKNEHFSRAKYGFCLPCRLTGYTEADAERLVDNSLAAKPEKGPFLLDGTEARNTPGYTELNMDLGRAAAILKAKGKDVTYDPSPTFVGSDEPLEGYASWGSNDAKFDADIYHSLKFKPGAIAETFVSTSARSFRPTHDNGQSMIADLIQQGVTGVKGYVSEPYVFSLARPAILFDRYTSGYNLAESFWMASFTMRWKDMVIGDPLCCPYHQ